MKNDLVKQIDKWLEENGNFGRDVFLNIMSVFKDDLVDNLTIKFKGNVFDIKKPLWFDDVINFRKLYEQVLEYRNNKENVSIVEWKKPKVLYIDLETTDLSAGFGITLMAAYKWNEQPTQILTLKNYMEDLKTLPPEKADKGLMKDIIELIEQADVLVAHFGERFDIPFIQTRCLVHRLPIIDNRRNRILDPWKIAKKQLACGRRLKALAKQLGCENQKDEVDFIYWQRSKCVGYNPYFLEALDKLEPYCIKDVDTLYDVTQLLIPLATHLPNSQLLNTPEKPVCPQCGGDVRYVKTLTLKANRYAQYQCKECGKWARSTKPEQKEISDENRLMY